MASEKLRPLAEFPRAGLAAVKAVLLDIDDTLSTDGHLTAAAYGALERLKQAGLLVVPITGRPAGWCDMIARFWPIDAVVGENGAFYFWHDARAGRLRQRFLQSEAEREAGRRKLEALRVRILREVPGAGIASDQPYRVADLAIDFCEDVKPLPREAVDRIVALFGEAGATAKISSIHVNGWFGAYDKLSMTRLALRELFAVDIDDPANRETIVFAGDSPNDAPMFDFFPNAVGVANVRDFGDLVKTLPRWVTEKRSGEGFVELASALLAARS
ncbi:MAG: HAD-IIB family hydrolase [Reyranellaceae bacterium]